MQTILHQSGRYTVRPVPVVRKRGKMKQPVLYDVFREGDISAERVATGLKYKKAVGEAQRLACVDAYKELGIVK